MVPSRLTHHLHLLHNDKRYGAFHILTHLTHIQSERWDRTATAFYPPELSFLSVSTIFFSLSSRHILPPNTPDLHTRACCKCIARTWRQLPTTVFPAASSRTILRRWKPSVKQKKRQCRPRPCAIAPSYTSLTNARCVSGKNCEPFSATQRTHLSHGLQTLVGGT